MFVGKFPRECYATSKRLRKPESGSRRRRLPASGPEDPGLKDFGRPATLELTRILLSSTSVVFTLLGESGQNADERSASKPGSDSAPFLKFAEITCSKRKGLAKEPANAIETRRKILKL